MKILGWNENSYRVFSSTFYVQYFHQKWMIYVIW